MQKKILIGAALTVVFVIAIGLFLPGTWNLESRVSINAPRAKIYQDLARLSTWAEWSPWNREKDKDCDHSYAGPKTGKGSQWSWSGRALGTGTMTLTSADPKTGLDYEIEFEGFPPFHGSIEFQPAGEATEVVWKSWGESGGPWHIKVMMNYGNLFGVTESAMQGEYDSSLTRLKFRAESGVAKK